MRQFMKIVENGHDYQPEWDYEVVDEPEHAKEIIQHVMGRVHGELLPKLGMDNIRVFYAHDLGGVLARYIYGTAANPVLGIDFAALEDACEEHGLDVSDQLAATIAHELAHAYQERNGSLNDDTESEDEHIEDEAEEFARRWVMDGVVDPSVL